MNLLRRRKTVSLRHEATDFPAAELTPQCYSVTSVSCLVKHPQRQMDRKWNVDGMEVMFLFSLQQTG